MVGEINFNALDTSIPGKTANSFNLLGQYLAGQEAGQSQIDKQQARQINALGLQKATMEMSDAATDRVAWKNSGGDLTKYGAAVSDPKTAMAISKMQQEQQAGQLKKAVDVFSLQQKHAGEVANNPTPENAYAQLDTFAKTIGMTPEQYTQAKAELDGVLAKGPEFTAQWAMGHSMDAKDKAQLAETQFQHLQSQLNFMATRKDAALGREVTMRGQDMADRRSKESTDRALAGQGLAPDGSIGAQGESLAQLIASGKSAPLTGFALARPGGQAVMGRVAEINPAYDATTYGAKADAAKKFTAGPLGVQMRSFATASQHLDQLSVLADALGNGDVQLINKAAQSVSQQLGEPAPTNFDAAKGIVAKEIVKSIVQGGGGVNERAELDSLMSRTQSPAQLKGVIDQYKVLMDAQHNNLLEQRRASGLSDETLPKYKVHGDTPPLDTMSSHSQIAPAGIKAKLADGSIVTSDGQGGWK